MFCVVHFRMNDFMLVYDTAIDVHDHDPSIIIVKCEQIYLLFDKLLVLSLPLLFFICPEIFHFNLNIFSLLKCSTVVLNGKLSKEMLTKVMFLRCDTIS